MLNSFLSDVFPGVKYVGAEMGALKEQIKNVCSEMYLTYETSEDEGSAWVDKVFFTLFWFLFCCDLLSFSAGFKCSEHFHSTVSTLH